MALRVRVVLLLPVYNESTTIIDVLETADPFCDLILVVDDGSHDTTRELLDVYARAHPKLFFVSHHTNRGMSGAILTGFLILREGVRLGILNGDDIVVTMDSDGQHDPRDIPTLTQLLKDEQADLVLGRRTFEKYPRVKRLGNWGLTLWASWWSGFRYQDAECGFRALRVQLLLDILRYFNPTQYGLAQEMAVIAARRSWRIINNVTIHVPRYRSGAKISNGFNNCLSAVRAWHRVRADQVIDHQPVWPDLLIPLSDADMKNDHQQWGLKDVF